MQFDSFNELLVYCKTCSICGGNCPIYIDIVDIPNGWVEHKSSSINNKILQVCGDIVEILGENNSKTSFEILIPFEFEGVDVNTAQFPDEEFEFFIDARCELCENRHVSTEDILVDKNGMSNFCIEEETICSEDFCIELNYSDGEVEISDIGSQSKIIKADIDEFDLDLSDINALNIKLQKYFMLL